MSGTSAPRRLRLPSRMSVLMIRRRSGVATVCSDPSVVYPAPEKADAAWNEATSGERPVMLSAIAPIRMNRIASANTSRSVRIG